MKLSVGILGIAAVGSFAFGVNPDEVRERLANAEKLNFGVAYQGTAQEVNKDFSFRLDTNSVVFVEN